MTTKKYEGTKFSPQTKVKTFDSLPVEEALQIKINGAAFTISMRTPGEDESLVRGLLHSEGIINDPLFTPDIITEKENEKSAISTVSITIPEDKLGNGYSNKRTLLSVSSCGMCGKTELSDLEGTEKKINDNQKIELELINKLFIKMILSQHDFNKSGGTHAAAVFSLSGDMLCSMEDVGRHNAVDKVIGKLINFNKLDEAKIITVSGRISYEIVIKCFKARIPFLASVSAPSSLAVDYAKELGITLLAFCRDNRVTCYSNPQRTKNKIKI